MEVIDLYKPKNGEFYLGCPRCGNTAFGLIVEDEKIVCMECCNCETRYEQNIE